MTKRETYLHNLNADDESIRLSAIESLRELTDTETIPTLIKALNDESPEVRRTVILALRQFKDDDRIIEPLVHMIKDHDNRVRRRASAWVMSRGIDKRLVEPMIALLADTQNPIHVREFAAMSLGSHRDRRALPHLNAILAEHTPQMRRRVVQSLSGMPDESSISVLIPILYEDDEIAQMLTAKTLMAIGTDEATEAIEAWRVSKIASEET